MATKVVGVKHARDHGFKSRTNRHIGRWWNGYHGALIRHSSGFESPLAYHLFCLVGWVGLNQRFAKPSIEQSVQWFESTTKRHSSVAYQARAPDSYPGGNWFESSRCYQWFDSIAQSVEHLTFNQGVESPNLSGVTIYDIPYNSSEIYRHSWG